MTWSLQTPPDAKGKYNQLSYLLNHCSRKGDVYHSGFREYVRTMTGWEQQGVTVRENTRTERITGAPDKDITPAAGHGTDGVADEANANLGQPSPHTTLVSDTRARHT